MSTEQQYLKEALTVMSADIDHSELLERVLTDVQRQQRRRRLWIGGAVIAAAAATVAGVIALAPSDRSAEPVPPAPVQVLLDPEANDVVDRPSQALMSDTRMIWVIDDDGRQRAVTTTDIAAVGGLALSDNGRWLVIAGTTGGEPRVSVVDTQAPPESDASVATLSSVTPFDGASFTQVTPLEGTGPYRPAVSPDGSLVAIAVWGYPGVILQLLPVDGGAPVVVSLSAEDWSPIGLANVAFSADGERLLVYPGNVGVLNVADVLAGTVATSTSAIPYPYTSAEGWDAAPDLSEILVGGGVEVGSDTRRWAVFDTGSGETVREIVRPAVDQPWAWSADGSQLWLHPSTRVVNAYEVVKDDNLTMVITPPAGQTLTRGTHVS